MSDLITTIPNFATKEFQYARFIAEINAIIGFSQDGLEGIADSMGVHPSDLQALINQAENDFEEGKASLFTGNEYGHRFVNANLPEPDVIAYMDVDGKQQLFCVEFNGEDYQAVFPEPLTEWSCYFVDHASCRNYLLHMIECLTRWQELGDIGVDDDDNLAQPFYDFARGTGRMEVWRWFEEHYDCSIVDELMPNSNAKIITMPIF